MSAEAGNTIGGEAFTASGFSALAVEHAGNDSIRMMHGQATEQIEGVFVGPNGGFSRNSPDDIQFSDGTGFPAQDQAGLRAEAGALPARP